MILRGDLFCFHPDYYLWSSSVWFSHHMIRFYGCRWKEEKHFICRIIYMLIVPAGLWSWDVCSQKALSGSSVTLERCAEIYSHTSLKSRWNINNFNVSASNFRGLITADPGVHRTARKYVRIPLKMLKTSYYIS